MPGLLRDGALRLRPHFVEKVVKGQVPGKRAARSLEPLENPTESSQKRTRGKTPIEQARLEQTLTVRTPLAPPPPSQSASALDDTEQPEPTIVGRNQFSEHPGGDASAQQRHLPPLPPHITSKTWDQDFAAAKQKYFDHHPPGDIRSEWQEQKGNKFAHHELIRGSYGLRARVACDGCSEVEQECRTYHPHCYQWAIRGVSAIELMGWRCGRCRYKGTSSCNVQWE